MSETISVIQHFEQYIPVSESLRDELDKRLSFTVFPKGTIIHDARQICRKSYFIQKGLVRVYFTKDGKEVSEYFSAEHEWVNSPRSFMQQQLDIYSIDAIEETSCACLHVQDLVYLYNHFVEMERYARLSMGSAFGHFMERIRSMRFTTAKEKYQHFCATYHDIYHRIPLGMVASYLGIAQETLSRIRAEQ
jgi:CRP-like cAMP-binding protein